MLSMLWIRILAWLLTVCGLPSGALDGVLLLKESTSNGCPPSLRKRKTSGGEGCDAFALLCALGGRVSTSELALDGLGSAGA